MSLDQITLSVIQASLQQVCDEMDLSFSRAAFSPVIAEANDRSDGIYSAVDGALIAQGAGGLPVFVGTMQYSTSELIRLISEGEVNPPEPEDIYIVNDPYLGGTHLMDVRFAYPYFRDENFGAGCLIPGIGRTLVVQSPGAFLRQQPQLNRRVCVCHL